MKYNRTKTLADIDWAGIEKPPLKMEQIVLDRLNEAPVDVEHLKNKFFVDSKTGENVLDGMSFTRLFSACFDEIIDDGSFQ